MGLNDNIDKIIFTNMKTHYSGLLKNKATDIGGDFMSQSIFNSINTNGDKELSQEEIDAAKPVLDSYIKKSVEQDSFYSELYFGKEFTEAAKKTNPNSNKTVSEQIIENNLNQAVEKILKYSEDHPEDTDIQKYADKLREIISKGNLKLTDISDTGVSGRAIKDENGDTILIDNHESIKNLNSQNLLQTLLHELRHTLETDDINSKAEELEAETTSRELADKISAKKGFYGSLSQFTKGYAGYAEASPGTYNIPENTGIAFWYKPQEVTMKENKLVVRSGEQEKLKGAYIEDQIQFGTEKDESGKQIPVSAVRVIKDKDGKIIFSMDYGKYDNKTKAFDYKNIYFEQKKLEQQMSTDITNKGFML